MISSSILWGGFERWERQNEKGKKENKKDVEGEKVNRAS